jgi:hypothetical protein
MLVILHVVDLWCPYLLGQRFQIKTDHQSLKYFLEQCISSPEKQKWVTKLFGYDYQNIYKKGNDPGDQILLKIQSARNHFKSNGSIGLIVTNPTQLIWVQIDIGSERYCVLFKMTNRQKKGC